MKRLILTCCLVGGLSAFAGMARADLIDPTQGGCDPTRQVCEVPPPVVPLQCDRTIDPTCYVAPFYPCDRTQASCAPTVTKQTSHHHHRRHHRHRHA